MIDQPQSSDSGLDTVAAVALAMDLMAIPGRSREEGKVVEFIRSKLLNAGLPASRIEVDSANQLTPHGGEVGNLIVKLPGTRRAPRRLLMAHMDTVPVCLGMPPQTWMEMSFVRRIRRPAWGAMIVPASRLF